MKTIALKEKTFEILRELKERKKIESFDKLLLEMIIKEEQVQKDLFGSLKGKTKKFSSKERDKIWKDNQRWQ